MLTITLPTEMVTTLTAEADRLGTTPELLALDSVRKNLPVEPTPLPTEGTLLDFLTGYVGTVAGSSEPFSQDCGKKFADGLRTERAARP